MRTNQAIGNSKWAGLETTLEGIAGRGTPVGKPGGRRWR